MSDVKLKGIFFYIPLDIATTPAEGHCYVNRWWSVHPEKGVAFYAQLLGYCASEAPAPQCNHNEFTAKHLARRYPDHEVVFLPAVYEYPAVREMGRLKKAAIAARYEKRRTTIAKAKGTTT